MSLLGGDVGLWAPVGLRPGFAWEGESVVEAAAATMDEVAAGGELGRPNHSGKRSVRWIYWFK